MIISHRHKFIFIKTEKTAGTSVEIALSRVCGPDDVITPLAHREDRDLKASLGPEYRTEQNYLVPFRHYTPLDWARACARRRRLQFYNHVGASEIRRLVPSRVWTSYYKFAVERNPWDKVISSYAWWRHLEAQYRRNPARFRAELGSAANGAIWMLTNHPVGDMDISGFVQSGRAHLIQGFDLYTIGGELAVDRVVRFERVQDELNEVTTHLGIRDMPPLPRAKSSTRQDRRSYREILTDLDRVKIADMFSREIARFGYQF